MIEPECCERTFSIASLYASRLRLGANSLKGVEPSQKVTSIDFSETEESRTCELARTDPDPIKARKRLTLGESYRIVLDLLYMGKCTSCR